ncbi:hypothetical protein R70006_04973 [Paraburkholderia domus]|uniref:type IV pilus biogenesis protein PilP n=1 Tax=Paraburkholderia domus TaxID=2793075 RepID=UPI0019142802|nr:type IV pilus biogenesis protein PilP [Paraburkholderia domus]MBK5051791.1 type IV pilus biogenesis protein PilP [Burkholderia sp. R-70006]CAE6793782.1 hypothetical protein R70006_04973 [Paraburkholderia domus]
MSKGNVLLGAVCALALISANAFATDEDNIGALGRIQTHTLILNARAKEKQAQELLDGKVNVDGTPAVPVAESPVDQVQPNVKLITNGDSGPQATFIYAGGVLAGGRVGSKIPGGYTIKRMSVADRSVEVTDSKGKLITLGMSSAAPVAPVATQPSSAAGRPSMMGGPMMVAPMMAR